MVNKDWIFILALFRFCNVDNCFRRHSIIRYYRFLFQIKNDFNPLGAMDIYTPFESHRCGLCIHAFLNIFNITRVVVTMISAYD